jgi:hypothetical protein
MQTITIREYLSDEMNKSRRVYNMHRRRLKRAEKLLAPIVDTEISAVRIYGGRYDFPFLSFRVKSAEAGRELAAMLMAALDINHAKKRMVLDDAYTIIIENDDLRLDIDVDARPCKKLLVTEQRVIEICGEIDESRYLSVVPLEE